MHIVPIRPLGSLGAFYFTQAGFNDTPHLVTVGHLLGLGDKSIKRTIELMTSRDKDIATLIHFR